MNKDWMLASYNWGRKSRGAVVRLGGLGEVLAGVQCPDHGDHDGDTDLCIGSAVEPGHYLVSRADTRIIWQQEQSQCARVKFFVTILIEKLKDHF